MRAMLFLFIGLVISAIFLWLTLSGALFVIGALFWLLVLVITVGYADTMVLYLLGAREVRSGDEKDFFEAASQEAYKLTVPMPHLYFYNGSLERAFVLHNGNKISIVLSKSLLEKSSAKELKAICFELLLQVKKRMASKRTKTMFMLGFFSWIVHSIVGLFLLLLPSKNLQRSFDWLFNYLLHPLLGLIFGIILGRRYFKRLENSLNAFESEKELLMGVGLKIEKPSAYYSIPSRKILEFSSINRSRHFQNILVLEFLPHEWDFLFPYRELRRAK